MSRGVSDASTKVASVYWRQLHGLLCVYRPPGFSNYRVLTYVQKAISRGLKPMIQREPRDMIQYDVSYGIIMESKTTDYSDHPLIIGPRYPKEDIGVHTYGPTLVNCSGVCLLGLNRRRGLARDLEMSKPLRVYHLYGQLGIATDNLYKTGKVLQRASSSRVFKTHIDKSVASMLASHQRLMYSSAGVPIQTQEAYDLAVKGLLRSADTDTPILYGMKCLHFERKFFKIEVACTNETEAFLLNLIHTIGKKVKSVATCIAAKCIRYGPFTLEHTLLHHDWNVEKIAENVQKSNAINKEDIKSGRRERSDLIPLTPAQNEISYAERDTKLEVPDEQGRGSSRLKHRGR